MAARALIAGTPFSITTILPAAELLGTSELWHVPTALAALATLLLGATWMVWRSSVRNLVLQTRLEESSKQQEVMVEKNRELEEQMSERRAGGNRAA